MSGVCGDCEAHGTAGESCRACGRGSYAEQPENAVETHLWGTCADPNHVGGCPVCQEVSEAFDEASTQPSENNMDKTIIMQDWSINGAAEAFLGIVPEEYEEDASEWEECPADWSVATEQEARAFHKRLGELLGIRGLLSEEERFLCVSVFKDPRVEAAVRESILGGMALMRAKGEPEAFASDVEGTLAWNAWQLLLERGA